MSEAKRYSSVDGSICADGGFVSFDDYAALKAEYHEANELGLANERMHKDTETKLAAVKSKADALAGAVKEAAKTLVASRHQDTQDDVESCVSEAQSQLDAALRDFRGVK